MIASKFKKNAAIQKSDTPDLQYWAWEKFLRATGDREITPDICPKITDALLGLTHETFVSLIGPVSDWLDTTSIPYASHDYEHFQSFLKHAVEVLKSDPGIGGTYVVKDDSKPSDWPMIALNSPSGKIAMALLDAPRALNAKTIDDFPEGWFEILTELINLPSPQRLLCLTIASYKLNWLYWHNPEWVKENILALFKDPDQRYSEVIWAGMLWLGKAPTHELYSEIKIPLLGFACRSSSVESDMLRNLAGFLLSGWWGEPQEISSEELRKTLINAGEKFRSITIRFAVSQLTDKPENEWAEGYRDFLRDVWPRQKFIRSQTVTEALCDGLLESSDLFNLLYDATMPHLSTLSTEMDISYELLDRGVDIIEKHPQKLAGLLAKILPDATTHWPHRIEEIFIRMEAADASISNNKDFKRMKLQWHGRQA